MEAEKRKLIKFSNYSLCVTLPKWVIRSLNWEKGDLVNMDVDADAGKIIITAGKTKVKKPEQKSESSKPSNLRW